MSYKSSDVKIPANITVVSRVYPTMKKISAESRIPSCIRPGEIVYLPDKSKVTRDNEGKIITIDEEVVEQKVKKKIKTRTF